MLHGGVKVKWSFTSYCIFVFFCCNVQHSNLVLHTQIDGGLYGTLVDSIACPTKFY
jgi:hypothetical protein